MAFSIGQSGLKWIWISIVVLVLDQWTKVLASSNLVLHETVAITSFFNITLAHNEGAAFSFLSDAGGWQRWFFIVLAIGVSIVLVVWLTRLAANHIWTAVAVTLILGGAVGNVWDRIQYGYVVDFIQVYYDDWYYPAFNIADSAICVGAVMLIIESFRAEKKETD